MQALLRLIERAEEVCLVSHVNPDGDAIGSLFGLGNALEHLHKRVIIVLPAGVPSSFSFLPHSTLTIVERIPEPTPRRICIVLDAPDSARTGMPELVVQYAQQDSLAFIDHHPTGDLAKLTAISLHHGGASSASELCYQVMISLEIKVTPAVSIPLLTGMYTDTGGFQYSNTSQETLEIAAELMRRGANLNRIVHQLSSNRSVASLRLLGIALERLRLGTPHQVASSVLTHADFQETGATAEDITGIASQLNVLPNATTCLFMCEVEPGTLRGSLRSGSGSAGKRINVARLAKLLGGGGHPRAAGFMLKGTIKQSGTHWHVH